MCFNQPWSFGFAALGLAAALWTYWRTGNRSLFAGIFFFFTMELLQGMQYFVIDQCGEGTAANWNRFMTVIGYGHICLQPFFTHVLNSAFTTNPITLAKFMVIKRLSLIGGALLFARFFMAPAYSTMNISPTGPCGVSTEWLRGETLCTFRGKYHLAWSVPMADPTYIIQGSGIHSFLMFAPFFVFNPTLWLQGAFLFLTGPYLASLITANLMEQASIWCFFSIAQICCMMLANWSVFFGRKTSKTASRHANTNGNSSGKTHAD